MHDDHTERAVREAAFGRRVRAPFIMGRILAANRKSTSPECAHADGPRRDIPARSTLAPRGWMTPRHLVQRAAEESVSPQNGGVLSTGHRGCLTQQAVKTIARGTPDVSGAFVVTTLVCFLLLHARLRMRVCIRRSVRPHREGDETKRRRRARALKNRAADARLKRRHCGARSDEAIHYCLSVWIVSRSLSSGGAPARWLAMTLIPSNGIV
jgi:hypothetical protein